MASYHEDKEPSAKPQMSVEEANRVFAEHGIGSGSDLFPAQMIKDSEVGTLANNAEKIGQLPPIDPSQNPAPNSKFIPEMIRTDEMAALDSNEERLKQREAEKQPAPSNPSTLKKWGKRTLATAGVGVALVAVGKAGDRSTPVRPSGPIPVQEVVNGRIANTVIPAEDATPAQILAHQVAQNNGKLPGSP